MKKVEIKFKKYVTEVNLLGRIGPKGDSGTGGNGSSEPINYEDILNKPDLNTFVEKIDGKFLSTNDYTTSEKNKLAGLSNPDLSIFLNKENIKAGNNISLDVSGNNITINATSTSGGGSIDTIEKPYKILTGESFGENVITITEDGGLPNADNQITFVKNELKFLSGKILIADKNDKNKGAILTFEANVNCDNIGFVNIMSAFSYQISGFGGSESESYNLNFDPSFQTKALMFKISKNPGNDITVKAVIYITSLAY